MIKLNLNENFICRIWENGDYYSGLLTTDGEPVEVLDYGKKNHDAGPDYKDAKIRIGKTVYNGSIEVHRALNDWYLHNHKNDNKYNDLILHIVFYENDSQTDIKNPVVKKARTIPTVVLSGFLSKSVHEIWKDIINNPSPEFRIPCYPGGKNTPAEIKDKWIGKLSMERLQYKSERIISRLDELTEDHSKKIFWDKVLFEFICEALGYSKNKEQFLKLASNIDLKEIKKMNLSRQQMESVLYGLSGFLHDLKFRDEYIQTVKSSWEDLKDVIRKEIMKKSEWNFFRLRPANFPTVRLSYASGLLHELVHGQLLKRIVNIFEGGNDLYKELTDCFLEIKVTGYWKTHHNFGKKSRNESKNIGRERITDIISNVLIPVLYVYAVKFGKDKLRRRVEYFYKSMKQRKSSNEITRVMERQLEVNTSTLSFEQGLIQLHNFYCVKAKCNECEIGRDVFKEKAEALKIILY